MIISNNMTAMGFIGYCTKQGVEVPKNLSIVSFDNIEIASLENIQLTTISQHVEDMSKHTVELMLRRIEHAEGELQHDE